MTKHTITIAKTGQTFEVNFGTMSEAVQSFIIEYGLTQKLADSIASIKSDDIADSATIANEAREKVSDVLDAMRRGEVPSSGGRTSDPVMQRAKDIAAKRIKAAIKKAGMKSEDVFAAMTLPKRIALLLSKNPDIIEQARDQIAAERGLDIDVDLDLEMLADIEADDEADEAGEV